MSQLSESQIEQIRKMVQRKKVRSATLYKGISEASKVLGIPRVKIYEALVRNAVFK